MVSQEPPKVAPTDAFAAAIANLRETAKWIVSSLAAVFALIIGASPLTGLGSLEPNTLRFAIGVAGLIGLLAAIAVMFWRGVVVLMSRTVTLEDVAQSAIGQDVEKHVRRLYPPGVSNAAELYQSFADAHRRFRQGTDSEKVAARAELTSLAPVVETTLRAASFEHVRHRFRSLCQLLGALCIPVAIATVCYAWAANPGKDNAKDVERAFVKSFSPGADGQELLKKAGLTSAACLPATLSVVVLKERPGRVLEGVTIPAADNCRPVVVSLTDQMVILSAK